MECGTPPAIIILKERRGNLYLSAIIEKSPVKMGLFL